MAALSRTLIYHKQGLFQEIVSARYIKDNGSYFEMKDLGGFEFLRGSWSPPKKFFFIFALLEY